jgi:dCMP deaminase
MDDRPELYLDREYKLRKTIHAEQNAIYNATKSGVNIDGSTFYVWGLHVCEACAQAIINVGAKRVVIPERELSDKWKDSCLNAAFDMTSVGITYDAIEPMI